jgi:hypothetical protein
MDNSIDKSINNNTTTYIKADNNIVVNEKYIRWIKKIDECMNICSRMNGCDINDGSILSVCKLYNPSSYNKLNKLFQNDE